MLSGKIIIQANANFHHVAGENLLDKRDRNFKAYREKWKRWPQIFHKGEFPLFIDIEVTSVCNLKCPFCATTFRENKIRKGFISFDTVRSIIDEGKDKNLYGVKFNLRGEPLLHPQIHDFVRYAKQNKLIDVYFNTNATLLTKKVANDLVDAGLDRISVSIEGYTKEAYEKYRLGAKFERVLGNIKNLQSLKKRRGVRYPKVRVQTVLLPGIGSSFREYEKFWKEYADEVAFIDYKEMKEKRKGVKFPWACPQLWQRMSVWWDGTILPCNHDDDGLIALGNLNKMTIEEAWNSDKLRRIREAHKEGRAHEVSACDGCYLRDSEIRKLTEREER